MHLSKLPSGHWRVAVKVGNRRRTASAATRRAAELRGAELLRIMGGQSTQNSTVAELVAENMVNSDWSATYRADVTAVVSQMPEDYALLAAHAVNPRNTATMYRKLAAGGWTAHRVRRLHEILAATFADAVFEGLLDDNPFRNVRKPPAPRRELVIPTDREVSAILNAPTSPLERIALRLAATLGGRRGEVVALQWRDVDLERESVVIRRSLAYTPASGVVTGITKTGDTGHRVLNIDPLTTVMLSDVHDEQTAQCAAQPGATPKWVISDDAGQTPWRPDRLTHLFAAARKATGVTGVRLHDLRHYVATTMLHDGETPIDVANQLGHSDTSTTLKVYAHYLPGRGRDSAIRRAIRLDAHETSEAG